VQAFGSAEEELDEIPVQLQLKQHRDKEKQTSDEKQILRVKKRCLITCSSLIGMQEHSLLS
jgi:hypothetical protein